LVVSSCVEGGKLDGIIPRWQCLGNIKQNGCFLTLGRTAFKTSELEAEYTAAKKQTFWPSPNKGLNYLKTACGATSRLSFRGRVFLGLAQLILVDQHTSMVVARVKSGAVNKNDKNWAIHLALVICASSSVFLARGGLWRPSIVPFIGFCRKSTAGQPAERRARFR
jgi:hypothetical protein